MFVLIPDHLHLDRVMQCITRSAPTSKLVDKLLHFNLWEMAGDGQLRCKISTQGPVFLRWLEKHASQVTSSFSIIIMIPCANPDSQIQSSNTRYFEMYNVQFRNFDNWVLEALRETPHEYQAFFPAAICLYASSDWHFFADGGISVVMDILSPVTKNNKDSYLTVWLSHHWEDDVPPPSRYISNLFNDPSRAAEFLVTEKHFTNFALLCAKVASGMIPCVVFLFFCVYS